MLSERASTRGGSGLRVFGAAVLFSLGFSVAKLTEPEPRAAAPRPQCEPAPAQTPSARVERSRPRRAVERPFLVRPMEVFAPADPEAELRYQKSQAEQLMSLVRQQIRKYQHVMGNEEPEVTASSIVPWVTGLTDGLVRTAPDLTEELAAQIEASVCDPQTDPAELITTSMMMKALPELANANTFECAFRRPGEDAVLWSALDAFVVSGLPKTDAFTALERSATNEHTRLRMLSGEERGKVVRERHAAEEAAYEAAQAQIRTE